MDTIKSFLSKHWLAVAFVTYAAILCGAVVIFDGHPSALLVVALAGFLAAMIFANGQSVKARMATGMFETLQVRLGNALTDVSRLNDKFKDMYIYRRMLLTWLTKLYPSGTRLERSGEGSDMELNTYLYVTLPAYLFDLEKGQLRFLLSNAEKDMFQHLPTFDGERTTILPGESDDILWKFLHSQKPMAVRPESFPPIAYLEHSTFAEDADALIAAAGSPEAVQKLEEATKPSGKPARRGSRGGRKGDK